MADKVYNNEYTTDFDRPGFCALCHIQIADFEGFKWDKVPRVVKLRGAFRMVTVRLSSGSKMKVAMCSSCKESFKPEDCGKLMESVCRGWQWEIENILMDENIKGKDAWTRGKALDYLDKYRNLSITSRGDTSWGREGNKKITQPDPEKQKFDGREVPEKHGNNR